MYDANNAYAQRIILILVLPNLAGVFCARTVLPLTFLTSYGAPPIP